MNEKTITFNDQEIQVLIQLLDIATKAGGLQVAEAAVVLQKKLQAPAVDPSNQIQIIPGPAESSDEAK